MDQLPPALPHGALREVFPDVFFVSGAMATVLMGSSWQFSRNMTVVRDGHALTLVNSIRLDDAGLDDAFYKARYDARFWALPEMAREDGLTVDRTLVPGGEMPFSDCSMFDFRATKLPECILRIDRADGILVACDSLQNWLQPDEFFSEESSRTMTAMGFFQPANLGPLWMQLNEPQGSDFARLRELPFRHALCGHGAPLNDTAREDFTDRFQRIFGI
jgi:hypothetical protein